MQRFLDRAIVTPQSPIRHHLQNEHELLVKCKPMLVYRLLLVKNLLAENTCLKKLIKPTIGFLKK